MYHSIASSGCAGEFRITIRLFTGGDISNKSVKTDKQKIRRTMGGESLESRFVAAIGGASLESRFDAAASSTSTTIVLRRCDISTISISNHSIIP